MESVMFQTASNEADLLGILELQSENHLEQISSPEEGFVTVKHDLQLLKKMNDLAPHVIAKDREKVVAYVLAMTPASKEDIPVLIPMFEQFNVLTYQEKSLSSWNYLVVGQVCVGKNYRGKGIFDKMYQYYKSTYERVFDFAVTEIALNNPRSIRAHQKLGFREIHQYKDALPMDWSIVLWDWK
ncbi:GNAT family N-acetyltransferase [Cecembia calidifontis]|uniref:Acetyltransferase (GNAT) family protein n=1 Tax=Cecembia calidifontis TaxID=1187080 RepID=A0A4Q7PC37_9BACT|nr:GNAT family N-acetyltransferase [Cecembia calidifontis]RZS97785.1 acetyltransferase (GNAT) family protein [Cecembia calidifontis]